MPVDIVAGIVSSLVSCVDIMGGLHGCIAGVKGGSVKANVSIEKFEDVERKRERREERRVRGRI